MSDSTTVHDWVEAAEEALSEVGTTALAFSGVEKVLSSGEALKSPFGAYVPLVATGSQIQIGVIAEWAACEAMARALFGMEPGAAFGAESDVRDAIGEIANMVAGGVKTRMSGRLSGLNLGLPMCVNGQVEPTAGAEYAGGVLLLGDVRASVLVLRSSTEGAVSRRSRASNTPKSRVDAPVEV